MSFRSILFDRMGGVPVEATEPEYFGDLQLDRIVGFMTAGFEEYDLEPFFYTSLSDIRSLNYR
jgi:DNA mismatch repair protein MutS